MFHPRVRPGDNQRKDRTQHRSQPHKYQHQQKKSAPLRLILRFIDHRRLSAVIWIQDQRMTLATPAISQLRRSRKLLVAKGSATHFLL
jgi:hypothetical protein